MKIFATLLCCGLIFGVCEIISAQGEPATCCATCSCTLCGDLASCSLSPFNASITCTQFAGQGCGNEGGTVVPCTEWYDNTGLNGTPLVDSYSSTSGTNPCIPIDGGLGFLIAGGLGIGVLGIRRREGQHLLERAA